MMRVREEADREGVAGEGDQPVAVRYLGHLRDPDEEHAGAMIHGGGYARVLSVLSGFMDKE